MSSVFVHGLVEGVNARLMDGGYVNWPNEKVANEVCAKVAKELNGPGILPPEAQLSVKSAQKIANRIISIHKELKEAGYKLDSDFAKQASEMDLKKRASAVAVMCMQKAAEEASVASTTENTEEEAAKVDSLAELDLKNRGVAEYHLGNGKTQLDTSSGEIGAEKGATWSALGGGEMGNIPDPTVFAPPQVTPDQIKALVQQPASPDKSLIDSLVHSAKNNGALGAIKAHPWRTAAVALGLPALGYGAMKGYQYMKTPDGEVVPVPDTSSDSTPLEVLGSIYDPMETAVEFISKVGKFSPQIKVAAATLAEKADFDSMNYIIKNASQAEELCTYVNKEQAKTASLADEGFVRALNTIEKLAEGMAEKAKGALGKVKDYVTGAAGKAKSHAGSAVMSLPGAQDLAKGTSTLRDVAKDKTLKEIVKADPKNMGQALTALKRNEGLKDIAKGVGKATAGATGAGLAATGAKKLYDKVTEKDEEKNSSLMSALKAAADGSLNDTAENTLDDAAKSDSVAELDKENRPEGEYTEGEGNTTLDTASGEIGDEKEAAEYLSQLRKVAEVYGGKLPAMMDKNVKVAHIKKLHGLPPNQRLKYLESLR